MLNYKEENILKSYKLNSKALMSLENVVLKNSLNQKKTQIYDIYAGDNDIIVGPESCMYDVLSRNGLIEKLYKSQKYFLSYNFQDSKKSLYLRLSQDSTLLRIISADEAWTLGKNEQLIEFLEKHSNTLDPDTDYNLDKHRAYKPKKRGSSPLNKAGDVLMFCAVVAMLITVVLCVWYFVSISQPMIYQY